MVGTGLTIPVVEQVILERIQFHSRAAISQHVMAFSKVHEISAAMDHAARALVLNLRASVVGKRTDKIDDKVLTTESRPVSVPLTWLDHFKLRWFPRWAIMRWPAKHRKIHQVIVHSRRVTLVTNRICPHIPDDGDDRQQHIRFCITNENEHPDLSPYDDLAAFSRP